MLLVYIYTFYILLIYSVIEIKLIYYNEISTLNAKEQLCQKKELKEKKVIKNNVLHLLTNDSVCDSLCEDQQVNQNT